MLLHHKVIVYLFSIPYNRLQITLPIPINQISDSLEMCVNSKCDEVLYCFEVFQLSAIYHVICHIWKAIDKVVNAMLYYFMLFTLLYFTSPNN